MHSCKKIITGFAVVFTLFSCTSEQQKTTVETYPVAKPIYIDTNTFVDYIAEIAATRNVEIRSMISGYLSKVHVDEGAVVKEGQLLFSINNVSYKESLTKNSALLKVALADAKNAELDVENTKSLVEKNVISKIELEYAKNKLQIARAKVEEARANETHARQTLSYTEIRAPFSGIINRLPQKLGSLVEEGTLLTTLSQNNQVFAYFDVSEPEYLNFMSQLTAGSDQEREVELVLANGAIHPKKGMIETMESQFDERTGNLSIRARFDNDDFILKHGASGKVRIANDFRHVLVIPQKSTFEIQDRLFVFVVDKNNQLKTRQIQVQARLPHLFVVSQGLTTSDRIVYEGIQSAEDGMTIKPSVKKMNHIIAKLAKY